MALRQKSAPVLARPLKEPRRQESDPKESHRHSGPLLLEKPPPTPPSSIIPPPTTPPPPIPPLATEDFDDLDQFEDAADEPQIIRDLQSSFKDCEIAIQKFFNNDLSGAMNLMKPWGATSLYHSLALCVFEFIPAVLTSDHGQIVQALDALKVCIGICDSHRRNYSLAETLGTIIRKTNYSMYTDLEAHAELCYAESLLLQAALTIMEGEDLTALIKGTLKIKNCYNSYKDCAKIVECKKWDSDESKVQFHTGVRLGLGAFNVMVSLLPPRIISVLEFVGFSGNKHFGLSELEEASLSPGLRSVLCDLVLLAYHLVICHFAGAPVQLQVCEEILDKQLQVYPDGVWFLVFKGRLELLRGTYREAVDTYNHAMDSQVMWPQFRHLCYWEIMWANALLMDWREAARYATKLIEESSWSRTIYTYTKAAMLVQLGHKMQPAERDACQELTTQASVFKQRIAGKSLPMEKFMIGRCARYQAQGGQLVLPAIELLCIWNMFPVLAKNERDAQSVLKMIEFTRENIETGPQDWQAGFEFDNRALLRYMQGVMLAEMQLFRMALELFDSVLQLKNDIKEDTFLVPYTVADMAMCHFHLGDKQVAVQMLQDARKKFSGYALESRLHFRLHSRMEIVQGNEYRSGSRLVMPTR